ncbi:MAG TPA: response regulator [Pseudolabrys sp.]|jgi:FixJ family two-component response regulator|nr:response regulator [Pseudolabrys sp.]
MGTADFAVYLIDDDPGVLKALGRLLQTAGYKTKAFSSSEAFLDEHDPSVPGCAVLDLAMPGLDGLELQQTLAHQAADRPIIFLTAHGNVPKSVRAMRAGAVDFLLKPVKRDDLLQAVKRAANQDRLTRRAYAERKTIHALLEKLTPREREVLTHVIAGRLNKQIAADLGTVEKTIKVHRSRMMAKMGVRTVAELVRLTEKVSLQPRLPAADLA